MPQLEDCPPGRESPLIDLSEIKQEHRALMWDTAVRRTFPSLSVRIADARHSRGTIDRIKMGAGEIFAIDSAPADVLHEASAGTRGDHPHLSLMVQSKGSVRITQSGTCVSLAEGDMCVIDEARSFRMIGESSSRILFLRMPRAAALSRYPLLEKLFATIFPGDAPGTRMLADTLVRCFSEGPMLGETQRNAMMGSIIHMLGVAEPFSALPAPSDWRVRRALDYIEFNLSVAGLTAETIAQDQNISRRRLDQLMHDALGHSIASHLWSRRLEQAAADLRDPQRGHLSIAQIAFANGFEDAAHFTRAFKRRFSVTPGQWRLN